jgi:hypothetical protein
MGQKNLIRTLQCSEIEALISKDMTSITPRLLSCQMNRLNVLLFTALLSLLGGGSGFAFQRLAISSPQQHTTSIRALATRKSVWSMVQTPPRPATAKPANRVSIQDMSRQMADAREQVYSFCIS